MLREPLECMLTVAKYKSFAKAAKELYLSTPAITQRINALEDELGFKLFVRSNKGAFLTAAGEAFIVDAEKMLSNLNDTIERCRAISAKEKSHLSIGVSGALNHYLLPKICENFRRNNKDIDLLFVDVKDPTSALLQGLIDINITYGNIGVVFPGVCNTTVFVDECVCYLSANHRLSDMKYIRVQDILNEKILLSPLDCSDYHRNLYAVLKKNNPSVHVDFVDSINVGTLKTITSDIISFYPKSYHIESENVTSIPFESFPYISIDALTRDEPQGIIKVFINEAIDLIRNMHN